MSFTVLSKLVSEFSCYVCFKLRNQVCHLHCLAFRSIGNGHTLLFRAVVGCRTVYSCYLYCRKDSRTCRMICVSLQEIGSGLTVPHTRYFRLVPWSNRCPCVEVMLRFRGIGEARCNMSVLGHSVLLLTML